LRVFSWENRLLSPESFRLRSSIVDQLLELIEVLVGAAPHIIIDPELGQQPLEIS